MKSCPKPKSFFAIPIILQINFFPTYIRAHIDTIVQFPSICRVSVHLSTQIDVIEQFMVFDYKMI